MNNIKRLLSDLPDRHRNALMWFHKRSGKTVSWPEALDDGTLVATRAKGIYKPAWTEYALSVRQALGNPYPDREPIERPDGTWRFDYYQEGKEPKDVERAYTNRGMLACLRDGVPVGVMRQIQSQPVRYRVLGLAQVVDWHNGYFRLEGISPTGTVVSVAPGKQVSLLSDDAEDEAEEEGAFDPENVRDARDRTMAAIVRRRGQPAFRAKLIKAYGGRCAITDADVLSALEAAHIVPYRGKRTNHISNGLLLRADIHSFLDLGLIAIDSESYSVLISDELSGSSYASLRRKKLRVPHQKARRPSRDALAWHRRWSGL